MIARLSFFLSKFEIYFNWSLIFLFQEKREMVLTTDLLLVIFGSVQMCMHSFVMRCYMSTASISKDFSIRSQKMADSLLDALVRSGKKSKWISRDSKNKASEMRRIKKLFAK